MNRKPLYAIVAFAALGIAALVTLRRPEKGEAAGDRQRPLGKVDATALDTIEVTRGGAKTAVKKDGAKFKVTAPVAYAADEVAAKAAFDGLTSLTLGDLVSENKAKHAEFEVDDAKGIHVVAKSSAGAVLADFLVGKVTGSGTMVRLTGKDDVWLAANSLRSAFDKAPVDWREKSVTTFPQADAETVTVKAKDGTMAMAKKTAEKAPGGVDDKWELMSSVPKIDKIDNSVPAGIVSALSAFKTNDFADGAAPAVTGLDAPALTVTVQLKGGKKVEVLIGNKKGDDDWYLKTGDGPQVFLIKKYNLERVNKRPIDWKDKTLCDIPEADLAEVDVTHGTDSFNLSHAAGAWKVTKPKLEVDPAKTPSLGGAFKDLKAAGFAEDTSPATTGLAKPKATILARPKKGDACSFKVGDETKDKQNVYLASGKSPDVYLAPKWAVDRILVKVDDLKKK